MIISMRKWWAGFQFIVLFAVLTLLAFYGCRFIMGWIMPVDPYTVPQGQAQKVFQANPPSPDGASMAQRLQWFYWMGE